MQKTFNCQRREQEKANPANHSEGEKPRPYKPPRASAWFGFDSPDRVQSFLQLPEDSAGAEQAHNKTDRSCQEAARRFCGASRNIFNYFEAAGIDKVLELFRN